MDINRIKGNQIKVGQTAEGEGRGGYPTGMGWLKKKETVEGGGDGRNKKTAGSEGKSGSIKIDKRKRR